MSYYDKYIKYKLKYLNLLMQLKKQFILPETIIEGENEDSEKSIIDSEKPIIDNEEQVKNGVWNKLPSELYVIGDIHGDFFALKQSLELTGCIHFDSYDEKLKYDSKNELYYLNDGCDYYNINENINWNPEKTNCYIVLAGDLIDRCRHDKITNNNCVNTINDENCDYKILKLLFDLDKEARKYNSRIIIVLGNHELFNIRNDLRYVSIKGKNDITRLSNIKQLLIDNINNIYGLVRINCYVIVHGGINDIYFKLFNKNVTLGQETIEVYNDYIRKIIIKSMEDNDKIDDELIDISPFMDRTLGFSQYNEKQCEEIFLNNLLNINPLFVKDLKVIVSHCPQFVNYENINLKDCEEFKNKIYKIDVGMSRAFDSYQPIDIIFNLLSNFDINMNYMLFYQVNNNYRAISILKMNDSEIILTGKLSIEYFYETAFKNNKDKFLYLLSDIKKILKLENKNIIDLIDDKIKLLSK